MLKEEFYKIVENMILPLFTGTVINGEELSSSRDSEVAFGKQNTLLIKADKSDEYRLVLKRGQAFKSFELNLLKSILNEINFISTLELKDANYVRTLQLHAVEKSICLSIVDEETASTMLGIIGELEKWSSRTYEGMQVALGIIIDQSSNSIQADKLHYSQIMNKEFFALLSDGINSYIKYDREGNLIGSIQLSKSSRFACIAPNDYEDIAKFCNDKYIGIVLTPVGDLLIFKNRTLLFAKRSGQWNVYSHEELVRLLSNRGSYSVKEIRRSIYYTALDSSFKYSGGCIVYLNSDMVENALTHINAHDILDEKYFEIKKAQVIANANKLYNLASLSQVEATYDVSYDEFLENQKCYKAKCLRKIIGGKPFQDLNRKLRQELVGMDGATVIDADGTVIAVGAILKIEAGSEGGGRLAAATTLAKYGIAIKISQDGMLKAFYADKKLGKIKTLFTVG